MNATQAKAQTAICPECGITHTPKRADALFCKSAHRGAFNNRRAQRGALLYDAFMALRYDRKWATAVHLWKMICRLASEWRAEDEDAARASFIRPERWVAANCAWLHQEKLGKVNVGRTRAT